MSSVAGFGAGAGLAWPPVSDTVSPAVVSKFGGLRLPSVTIILVNYNGRDHLEECLNSVAKLDYPGELLRTVLVDNDSRDGSRELLAAQYPWVEVLKQSSNLGFSPAVNLAAQHAGSECIALLNNDMRVNPGWIQALVDKYDPPSGIVCVGGLVTDWNGERVDFIDGTINLHGFGHQQGFGDSLIEARAAGRVVDGRVLPFANGGSMLVQRALFVDLGGFDAKFFAYFEDVDFGWRLMVCGYRTVLAATSIANHRHHGTSSRLATHERVLLLERNSLRSLIKNVDDENLPKILAAAALLASRRAAADARSDRTSYDVGAGQPEMESVHRIGTARMHALNDVIADLEGPDGLLALRRDVQSRRQAPDSAVFASFGKPFEPLMNDTAPYVRSLDSVVRLLNLRELFPSARQGRVVVLSAGDVIGERMAGTAIRAWELACSLGAHVPTVLASPKPIGRSDPRVETFEFADAVELRNLVDRADAVIVFGFDLRRYPFLPHTSALLVVDLYDPWIFGSLEQYDTMTREEAEGQKAHEIATLNELMDLGDFFLCASERQRDFWIGMLASRGRLDRTAHLQDAHLRSLIDVVPFGCSDIAPQPHPSGAALVGNPRWPDIPLGSKVVLWGGGTWDWFDPVGVLEAFVRVQRDVPEARLFFMGLELEGRGVPEMSSTKQLRERAAELGVLGSTVFFGPWVPYDERGSYLLDAAVGVVAAKAMAESRLAWRTRMLDHFWAALPTIATAGDVLADLIHDEGAGLRIAANDAAALEDALRKMLTDDAFRAACAARAGQLADRFRWSGVVDPLVRLATDPAPWRTARAARRQPHSSRTGANGGAGELERLSAELAETHRHLAAARRKLDVLNKTPIYPIFKAAQRARTRLRGGA